MTVYVDDAFISARVGRIQSRWCHLIADTEDELHEFAGRLGLQRSWFQAPKGLGSIPLNPTCLKAQMWHYDVTSGKRVEAIRLGAVAVTSREQNEIIRARHARLFPVEAAAADAARSALVERYGQRSLDDGASA